MLWRGCKLSLLEASRNSTRLDNYVRDIASDVAGGLGIAALYAAKQIAMRGSVYRPRRLLWISKRTTARPFAVRTRPMHNRKLIASEERGVKLGLYFEKFS